MSLNFKIYFLEFPSEIVFVVSSGNYFISKLQENVKTAVKYLKLFWYTYKKLKLLDFLSDFVLISV